MRRGADAFQSFIFLSRWLAAPFLIGLVGGLLLLLYRFFVDLAELAMQVATQSWHTLVVGVLNLVDISLTANLIILVIFSGYENFVRHVDLDKNPGWPAGLVDVDFSALKQRLLGAIAVIAAVDALAWYFDLEGTVDLAKLGWAVGFPLMFAVAMVLLALADRLARRSEEKPK
ncbi:MAG: YqhA family protein [Xanthobacteraceae bacterium]